MMSCAQKAQHHQKKRQCFFLPQGQLALYKKLPAQQKAGQRQRKATLAQQIKLALGHKAQQAPLLIQRQAGSGQQAYQQKEACRIGRCMRTIMLLLLSFYSFTSQVQAPYTNRLA